MSHSKTIRQQIGLMAFRVYLWSLKPLMEEWMNAFAKQFSASIDTPGRAQDAPSPVVKTGRDWERATGCLAIIAGIVVFWAAILWASL